MSDTPLPPVPTTSADVIDMRDNSPPTSSRRPQVPSPLASSIEVREFLTNFFLVLDHDLSREEAESRAKKTPTDGKGLYEIPESKWEARYDDQGLTIYRELRESQFGRVQDGGPQDATGNQEPSMVSGISTIRPTGQITIGQMIAGILIASLFNWFTKGTRC